MYGGTAMFDEFFYRRRKNKGMLVLSILFIGMAILMVIGGIAYLT